MPGKNSPQDSKRDRDHLQPDKATLDLPEVKDIPGQENIHAPDLKEVADTTISSDDEEGVGIWDSDRPNKNLNNEQFGPAQLITEDDLDIKEDNRKLEARSDEDTVENTDEDLDITDDSVDEESDVTPEEKKVLERTEDMDTPDNENLYRAELDDTDFEGEKLNEDIEVTGEDLDVPGAELDDADEEIGEEDEENNAYSLGDTE